MGRDPGMDTYDKDCIDHIRIMQGREIPEGTAVQEGVFLELWEYENSGDRVWAVGILDDYRHHLGEGIRIQIGDDVAGRLRREYEDPDGDTDASD